MNRVFFAFFTVAAAFAATAGPDRSVNGWSAYDQWRKPVPLTQSAGDIITLTIPQYGVSRPNNVAFLTSRGTWDLRGKTITATFWLETAGTPAWFTLFPGGSITPCNMRFHFSTVPGAYWLNYANRHETLYWWSQEGWAYMKDLTGVGIVTFTATIDGLAWSDALGHGATDPDYTAAFNEAAANCQTIGFSFGGGNFYDTGIYTTGTGMKATLHLLTFNIN